MDYSGAAAALDSNGNRNVSGISFCVSYPMELIITNHLINKTMAVVEIRENLLGRFFLGGGG